MLNCVCSTFFKLRKALVPEILFRLQSCIHGVPKLLISLISRVLRKLKCTRISSSFSNLSQDQTLSTIDVLYLDVLVGPFIDVLTRKINKIMKYENCLKFFLFPSDEKSSYDLFSMSCTQANIIIKDYYPLSLGNEHVAI